MRSFSTMWRLVPVAGLLLLLAVSVAACSSDPEAAYRDVAKAADAGDWGRVYDSFDKKSQGQVDATMMMLAGLASMGGGEAQENLEGKTGRDLFVAIVSSNDSVASDMQSGDFTVTEKSVEGDKATLTIARGDGEPATVAMVKEDGAWKVSLGDDIFGAGGDSAAGSSTAEDDPEQQARIDAMNAVVAVTVSEKGFRPADIDNMEFSGHITMSIDFENKSDQDLDGVKGVLVFRDMFGDVIKEINVSYDEGLAASSTKTWPAEVELNEYMDEDTKLNDTPLEKLDVEWVPDTYVFSDGTTLKASE